MNQSLFQAQFGLFKRLVPTSTAPSQGISYALLRTPYPQISNSLASTPPILKAFGNHFANDLELAPGLVISQVGKSSAKEVQLQEYMVPSPSVEESSGETVSATGAVHRFWRKVLSGPGLDRIDALFNGICGTDLKLLVREEEKRHVSTDGLDWRCDNVAQQRFVQDI